MHAAARRPCGQGTHSTRAGRRLANRPASWEAARASSRHLPGPSPELARGPPALPQHACLTAFVTVPRFVHNSDHSRVVATPDYFASLAARHPRDLSLMGRFHMLGPRRRNPKWTRQLRAYFDAPWPHSLQRPCRPCSQLLEHLPDRARTHIAPRFVSCPPHGLCDCCAAAAPCKHFGPFCAQNAFKESTPLQYQSKRGCL
mmetsp:Transcript_53001/g.115656  ORF Transcript_53001/g.115656 Transcript_53001/m.115656 type:complete len:201 (+) Transcript_53001:957-1559(+)|eukprot:6173004-Pleurochrysis_carterae.AAC.4